jgi:ribosomal protein S6
MEFDANPRTMEELQKRLRQDPTVLRSTTLKLGSRLMESVRNPSKTQLPQFKLVDPTMQLDHTRYS